MCVMRPPPTQHSALIVGVAIPSGHNMRLLHLQQHEVHGGVLLETERSKLEAGALLDGGQRGPFLWSNNTIFLQNWEQRHLEFGWISSGIDCQTDLVSEPTKIDCGPTLILGLILLASPSGRIEG